MPEIIFFLGKRKEEDTMRELGGGSFFSIEEVRGRVRAFERRGGEGTLEVGHFHKTDTTLSKRIRSERKKIRKKKKKRKVSRSLLHILSVLLLLGLSLFFSASIPSSKTIKQRPLGSEIRPSSKFRLRRMLRNPRNCSSYLVTVLRATLNSVPPPGGAWKWSDVGNVEGARKEGKKFLHPIKHFSCGVPT